MLEVPRTPGACTGTRQNAR